MLEEDIQSLYERMAGMEQPPSSIGIPGAGRAGRARLARRRAAAVATPVLAAAAVIAIALAASVQGGLPERIRPAAQRARRSTSTRSALLWGPGIKNPANRRPDPSRPGTGRHMTSP